MLSTEDAQFYQFWTENRLKYKKSARPFLVGLSVGFALGAGILMTIYLGWYERANMQLNSSLSPFLFLAAIMGIAVFMAIFYRNYQWEAKEQRYLSILARIAQSQKNEADAAIEP